MFYQVRVLDEKKQLKKIISVRELSRKHWSEFDKKQKGFASPRIKMNKQPNN
jgi:hypothetical protein